MDMGLLHVLILRVPKICIDVDNPIIIGSIVNFIEIIVLEELSKRHTYMCCNHFSKVNLPTVYVCGFGC